MEKKAVLVSIRPEWVQKILSGVKTVEVRKNRPQIYRPFKLYIYCTKPKDILLSIIKDGEEIYGDTYHGSPIFVKVPGDAPYNAGGKVVAECLCYNIFDIEVPFGGKELGTCLTPKQMYEYANGKSRLYGLELCDIKQYRQPIPVTDFQLYGCIDRVKRPPQSWMYVNAKPDAGR